MVVQIPLGSEPDTILQVLAPTGAMINVQIPPGAAPGSSMTVNY